MGQWTVSPDTVRKDLTYEGTPFWVELKKELTVGEEKRLYSSGFRSVTRGQNRNDADIELNVNYDVVVFTKVHVWLADWSLSENGKKLPLTLDTLRAMRGPVFDLLEKTVDEHSARVAQELSERAKNDQTSEPVQKTISA